MELPNDPGQPPKKPEDDQDKASKKGKRVLGKRRRKFRTSKPPEDSPHTSKPPEETPSSQTLTLDSPRPSTSRDEPSTSQEKPPISKQISPRPKRPKPDRHFFIPRKLKEIYHILHTFVSENPLNSSGIYEHVEDYLKSLEALGFRPLNCICCVCKYIEHVAVMFREFEKKTQDDVSILEFIDVVQDFFRAMDAKLVQTVQEGKYKDDIDVTKKSAIYKHIYDNLISVLETFKDLILESISKKSLIAYPDREVYTCDLVVLVERIKWHLRNLSAGRFSIVEDLTENRRYFYDESWEDNWLEWEDFIDKYYNKFL